MSDVRRIRPDRIGPFAVLLAALLLGAATAGAQADADGPRMRSDWDPFPGTIAERLGRETFFIPLLDGGFGARLMLRHEAGTSPNPVFVRDGLVLGVGHRWADDPWTVAFTGQTLVGVRYEGDAWGSGGAVILAAAETDTAVAVTETRFFKGPHETYLRSVAFRTPRAPWRIRFDFEELLDQQGYDFRISGDARTFSWSRLGEAKFRSSRAVLTRTLADGRSIAFSHEMLRKHKTGLPADSLRHEEIWGDRTALVWRAGPKADAAMAGFLVEGADVLRDGGRKLEVDREGVVGAAAAPFGGRLAARAEAWHLHDTMTGVADWALEYGAEARGEGERAAVAWTLPLMRAAWRGDLRADGSWDSRAGWRPGAGATLRRSGDRLGLDLSLDHGGRSPRSDELFTPDRRSVSGRTVLLLPAADLGWERETRAAMTVELAVLGGVVSLDGSLRRLRDGIGWRQDDGDPDTGRWANDLEMDSWTATAGYSRRARLWGRLRLSGRYSRRGVDIRRGVAVGLPPERSARADLAWEHHFFHGDGVVELGYALEHRGVMPDPWLPRGDELPSVTLHHLLAAFRLVGADLSLELRNLTDERAQISGGALTDGREMRWRLQWSFLR